MVIKQVTGSIPVALNERKMKRYVFSGELDLPGGKYVVIIAEIPNDEVDFLDINGVPLRRFWQKYKFFKRKINAEKYRKKVGEKQRNDHFMELILSKGLMSLN